MTEHPFDARRALLIDQPLPGHQWRVSSLVSALRGAIMGGAELHRGLAGDPEVGGSIVRGITDELTRRGIDGDSLVRYGMAPEIVARIFATVLPAWPWEVLPSGTASPEPSQAALHLAMPVTPDVADGWVDLLRTPPPRTFDSMDAFVEETRGAMRSLVARTWPWVMVAPLDDLLTLRPPSQEALDRAHEGLVIDPSLLEQYRWAVERFSVTHLTEWSTSSLHLEHRWLVQSEPGPCSNEVMADRPVDLRDLQAEIAMRATAPDALDADALPAGVEQSLVHKVYEQALESLREGRPREAATLFEFAANQAPRDNQAINNLGFCLMPDNPARALEKLTQAAKLGYGFPAINIYNQAVCHYMLGQRRDCLALLEERWPSIASGQLSRATLWILQGGQLVLAEKSDALEEVVRFAQFVAEESGQPELAAAWAARKQI